MRRNHPIMWQALRDLYYETNSPYFKYGKTLQEVEQQMDKLELKEKQQLRLFEDEQATKI